jgi:membrane fusion protein, multidrug efflux system
MHLPSEAVIRQSLQLGINGISRRRAVFQGAHGIAQDAEALGPPLLGGGFALSSLVLTFLGSTRGGKLGLPVVERLVRDLLARDATYHLWRLDGFRGGFDLGNNGGVGDGLQNRFRSCFGGDWLSHDRFDRCCRDCHFWSNRRFQLDVDWWRHQHDGFGIDRLGCGLVGHGCPLNSSYHFSTIDGKRKQGALRRSDVAWSTCHDAMVRGMTRVILAGLLVILAACGTTAAAPKKAVRMPVLVAMAAERPLGQAIHAGGSLEPDELVQIAVRVAGAAERVGFHAGTQVEAGQVLVEIEPERFRIALERAEAASAKATAQVAEASASLARRRQLAQRSDGLVTDEELATWSSRLAQAEADNALAAADLAQARLNARDAIVRAAIAGSIETRTVNQGQYLAVGDVIATQVRRLPLRLRARVTTSEAALLRRGQTVQVTVDGQQLSGTLTLIAAAADTASRSVAVSVEIPQAPDGVVAGAFAEMLATVGAETARLAVPASALRAGERGWSAFVIDGDGDATVARRRSVQPGLRSADGWVEIRSGIAPGERVAVRGADALRDGQDVSIAAGR